jgi:hypothetical protein
MSPDCEEQRQLYGQPVVSAKILIGAIQKRTSTTRNMLNVLLQRYQNSQQIVVNSQNAKLTAGGPYNSYETGQYLPAHPRQLQPRLSANEVEDEDEIDPFISGPNFFDTTTTAASTKESIKTKTTTSSTSPSASAKNILAITSPETPTDSKSSFSLEDNRSGSPVPLQKYQQPVSRGQSRRVSRTTDDDGVTERQVGGERRLYVVNASPSESEDEA